MKRGTARLHPTMGAFSQSKLNSGSAPGIQPTKGQLLVGIIPHQKQIHRC